MVKKEKNQPPHFLSSHEENTDTKLDNHHPQLPYPPRSQQINLMYEYVEKILNIIVSNEIEMTEVVLVFNLHSKLFHRKYPRFCPGFVP